MKQIIPSVTGMLFMSILTTNLTYAQTIDYTDVTPDKVMTGTDVFPIHLAKQPDSVTYGETGSLAIWNEDPGIYVVTWTDCEVLIDGSSPAALSANDSIKPGSSWASVNYAPLFDGTGHWANVNDKYLGVRFKKSSSGSWYYGWVRMDVNGTATSVTIKDYAYNTTAGASIAAGEQTGSVSLREPSPGEKITIRSSRHWIYISGAAHGTMTLTTLSGSVIRKITLSDNEQVLKMDDIANGIYMVTISQKSIGQEVQKIVLY